MILAFQIGGIVISAYQLMLVAGTAGMFLCTYKRRTLFLLNHWQCIAFAVVLTAVGVAGAMLLYFWESGTFGGVSFYGSVFLIPLVMSLLGFLFGLRPNQTMDICGPCVAVMIGCMRFGCFLTGCCGGLQMCIGNFCFNWPTQVMESILDFAIVSFLLKREEQCRNKGQLYPLFLVLYSIVRFFIEFIRNTPKDWLFLSHGQWFSIAALLSGLLWIGLQNNSKGRQKGRKRTQ